jgi:hypothetical protein
MRLLGPKMKLVVCVSKYAVLRFSLRQFAKLKTRSSSYPLEVLMSFGVAHVSTNSKILSSLMACCAVEQALFTFAIKTLGERHRLFEIFAKT